MTRIGLEIHCQLTSLQSKLFCPCKADYRGSGPNENVCPVCMGLPGSLPLLNREAVKGAILIAMALNCETPERIAFFRKNYFYPDLPKNFQITQLNIYGQTSVGGPGHVMLGGKKIGLTRVQLEEDPGRLIHEGPSRNRITMVDYNRAGAPLVEIVTEPDFEDPGQVRAFAVLLSDLLGNLGVADPSLEGAMRADANVSIEGGAKVEIKNVGSFHDLEKAVHFEITRQDSLRSRGMEVRQETRHWDERRKITVSSRSKGDDPDYRYFLEGDIPWVRIGPDALEELKSAMPETISSRRERYVSELGLPGQVADVLSADRFYSGVFERAQTGQNAREIANLITSDLMGLADTREKRAALKITPESLRELADAVLSGSISRISAKDALYEMAGSGKNLAQVVSEKGLGNVTDESELGRLVQEVVSEEPRAAGEARSNPEAVNYLLGKVMKKTGGRADPHITISLIRRAIGA